MRRDWRCSKKQQSQGVPPAAAVAGARLLGGNAGSGWMQIFGQDGNKTCRRPAQRLAAAAPRAGDPRRPGSVPPRFRRSSPSEDGMRPGNRAWCDRYVLIPPILSIPTGQKHKRVRQRRRRSRPWLATHRHPRSCHGAGAPASRSIRNDSQRTGRTSGECREPPEHPVNCLLFRKSIAQIHSANTGRLGTAWSSQPTPGEGGRAHRPLVNQVPSKTSSWHRRCGGVGVLRKSVAVAHPSGGFRALTTPPSLHLSPNSLREAFCSVLLQC